MKVALIPGVPALLAQYASIQDPVAGLRGAVRGAVDWLADEGPVRVLAEPRSRRIAAELLPAAPTDDPGAPLLVVANGSAMRTEKAPGHFDARAERFDEALRTALLAGDTRALAGLDAGLAADLWAEVGPLRLLGESSDLTGARAEVDFDGAPYGVQYWVVRFTPRGPRVATP